MKVIKRAGETVKLERSVLNTDNSQADLTGVIAKFVMVLQSKDGSSVRVEKDCTVTGNVLSVTLDSSETEVPGRYRYEFRIKLNGEESSIDSGMLILKTALVQGL